MTTPMPPPMPAPEFLEWSDGIEARSRRPFLFFRRAGALWEFTGKNIPKIAVVVGSEYRKNGKWSATTYRIKIAVGVEPIAGWGTGTLGEGLGVATNTWAAFATALGVEVSETKRFLGERFPKVASKIEGIEAALAVLDAQTRAGG